METTTVEGQAASISKSQAGQTTFEAEQVTTIVGGHFIHDTYTAFVSPLLPVIIERLSLSLTQAGSLNAILQFPALINPLIGYLADRVSLRYFVIFAPAITGTLISVMGLTNSYWMLAVLFFVTGISTAAFHAPAPAMIARVSGNQIGKGMGWFMAGGELGRTVGPLMAVWAVSLWGLDGFWRMLLLGWAASLIMLWRLKNTAARPQVPAQLREILPALGRLFLPLAILSLFRNFLVDSLTTYLPTYLNQGGTSLLVAGGALSILELAGVAGALTVGLLSDRLGRKPVLAANAVLGAVLMLVLLNASGWLLVPTLLVLGFVALSSQPVMLTIVQDCLPRHRAVGNGLFMTIAFLLRPISILGIGFLGDHFGLKMAFYASALISLLAIPAVIALPRHSVIE
jgi:FSR family fosmidomycin resistance protein-like MFS transporter